MRLSRFHVESPSKLLPTPWSANNLGRVFFMGRCGIFLILGTGWRKNLRVGHLIPGSNRTFLDRVFASGLGTVDANIIEQKGDSTVSGMVCFLLLLLVVLRTLMLCFERKFRVAAVRRLVVQLSVAVAEVFKPLRRMENSSLKKFRNQRTTKIIVHTRDPRSRYGRPRKVNRTTGSTITHHNMDLRKMELLLSPSIWIWIWASE
mmetsp:Transcript_7583/g.18919  ORF Transcript_7583/g.18919 Transcript_7583/m.18919 type:complete len:204 (-) Transcript_7583:138-749(-)